MTEPRRVPAIVSIACDVWVEQVKTICGSLTADEEQMARASALVILRDWYEGCGRSAAGFEALLIANDTDGMALVAASVDLARSIGKRKLFRSIPSFQS